MEAGHREGCSPYREAAVSANIWRPVPDAAEVPAVKPEAHERALELLTRALWTFVIEAEDGRQGAIDGNRYHTLWRERKWQRFGYRVIAIYVRSLHFNDYGSWNSEYNGWMSRLIPLNLPVVLCASLQDIRAGTIPPPAKRKVKNRPRD